MSRILNLAPIADQTIILSKPGKQFAIQDRIPASLMPFILDAMDQDGNVQYTPHNLYRLCQIFARMIVAANPGVSEEEALDFLSVNDIPDLVSEFLNPTAPSSGTETTPTEEETSKASTRRRKR